VAEAGFRRCYFAGQYSVLDGEQVLRAAGISLVWVDTRPAATRPAG
jgi:dCMP deaminase